MATKEAIKIRETGYDQIGGTALRGAGIEFSELGVNDLATHLDQYLRYGEDALEYIEEDLITDCGERMADSKFINQVRFTQLGNDFVSEKGKFSMLKMTANTKGKMDLLKSGSKLQKRAEIESKEPARLLDWLPKAEINEAFVVESHPLADNEEYAVTRIYQNLGQGEIMMHVIILHNPSVKVFNQTRKKIGVEMPQAASALGLLDSMYAVKPNKNNTFDGFVHQYVDAYDETLTEQSPGREFVFGLSKENREDIPDSNETIRRQKPLLSIYKDTIRALGQSNWQVTEEVISINQRLKLGMNLSEGQAISLEQSRELLDGALQYIVTTLNNAPKATLDMLAAFHKEDSSAAYGVASHYGGEAKAAGIRYESSACPTVRTVNSTAEQAIAEQAFRLNKDPTKCVQCPGCNNIVDLPKDLYKKNILHCVECKMTVKDGKLVHHSEVLGKIKEKAVSGFEIIAGWFRKEKQEEQIKKTAERQAIAELGSNVTYLDKKRYEKQIRKQYEKQAA